MLENNENITLKKVHMKNFLCFDDLTLNFEKKSFLVVGNESGSGKTAFIKAIQFVVSQSYVDPEKAMYFKKKPSTGNEAYVELIFEVETNNDSKSIFSVKRDFSSLDLIHRTSENKNQSIPIQVFQNFFCSKMWNNLEIDDFKIDQDNQYIFYHIKNYIDKLNAKIESNKFECENLTYAVPFMEQQIKQKNESKRIQIKTYKNILDAICKIFAYFTSDNYKLKCVVTQDLEVQFFIININDNIEEPWFSANTYLKFMLHVSLQIAYCTFYNQKFIFLTLTENVQDASNFNYFERILINDKFDENLEKILYETNFLQALINICNAVNIIIFIELHNVTYIEDCNILHFYLENKQPMCKLLQLDKLKEDLAQNFICLLDQFID